MCPGGLLAGMVAPGVVLADRMTAFSFAGRKLLFGRMAIQQDELNFCPMDQAFRLLSERVIEPRGMLFHFQPRKARPSVT